MAYAYPLMLDVTQRLIVIVGGGAVAARKATGVIEAGATRLRVIAPERTNDFMNHPSIEFIAEQYCTAHLDDAGLVFAATNEPTVNDAVVQDARERGVLVCRADSDDETPGNFITPAKFTESLVTVTVSAGSAALSARIRDGLKSTWNARWSRMADAMETLRPEIRASGRDSNERRAIFRNLASDEAMDVLDAGGIDGLRSWMKRNDE